MGTVDLMSLPRRSKRIIQAFFDACILLLSLPLAMTLRLENIDFVTDSRIWVTQLFFVPLGIMILACLGVYRPVIRYISTLTMIRLIVSSGLIAVLMFFLAAILNMWMPRSVPLIMILIIVVGTIGGRYMARAIYRRFAMSTKTPVIVYGAGDLGTQLVPSLQQGTEYQPLAIIDPTGEYSGLEVSGVRVHGVQAIGGLLNRYKFKHVLIALDDSNSESRRAVVDQFSGHDLELHVVPNLSDILAGRASIVDLRPVNIEELLGRPPVAPRVELIDRQVRGKRVLVSGAGGSIGSELCRQIIRNGPLSLVLVEASEFALYSIDRELRLEAPDIRIIPRIANVRDDARMREIISQERIDTIYHAAAYKHVPLVEENVCAGVENNVFGTEILARAATDLGVGSFTLISTDKAVRPTNVMGASKRVAELICQGLAANGGDTLFSIVRFGNVLGSSGSVIPLFRSQIDAGGPVTVTDPDVTRYFMTIPEAAGLVLQASGMATGGDTFLLDMGKPMRISDLAVRMIAQSGKEPFMATKSYALEHNVRTKGDIEIRFTGLRPGEKLYEELLIDATSKQTSHPRILRATEDKFGELELTKLLRDLRDAVAAADPDRVRAHLKSRKIGYLQTKAPPPPQKVPQPEHTGNIAFGAPVPAE